MKTCSRCGTQFNDDLNFCLNDGTPLTAAPVSPSGERTVEMPGERASEPTVASAREFGTASARTPSIAPKSRSKARYLIPLAIVLLLGLGIAAAGLFGIYWYLQNREAVVVSTDSNNGNSQVMFPEASPDDNTAENANDLTNSEDNSATGANSSNSADVKPTPSPSRTPVKPTPSPTKTERPTPEPTADPRPWPTIEPRNGRNPPVPKTISGGVLNGKATSLPKPPYPPAARAVRASGAVHVQVLIDESGRVVSARAVSGHPLLRAAATSAARSARFSPTMLSGQAVKVTGVISYNFVP